MFAIKHNAAMKKMVFLRYKNLYYEKNIYLCIDDLIFCDWKL